jgi:hypothetical protein
VTISFNFANGASGWQAGFADYSTVQEESMELDPGIKSLPSELGSGTGFMIQGHNRSDDLFMFLKRRLGSSDGLRANRSYQVAFRIVFGSNAQTGCFGVGGPPGEAVFLKAGAVAQEPLVVLNQSGASYMNGACRPDLERP